MKTSDKKLKAFQNSSKWHLSRPLMLEDPIGLYVHIPFCDRICHYCDFAKTANHDKTITDAYFGVLNEHLGNWLQRLSSINPGLKIDTVFFGGGTPSLFGSPQYLPLFEKLSPYLLPNAEVTLEANPNHSTVDNLVDWKNLGFNRISLGVQSYSNLGLKSLTRNHTSQNAVEATKDALEYFGNVNVDLIYGWTQQTIDDWQKDLQTAINLKVPHLSIYNLTFEPGTALGRKKLRGKIQPVQDSLEEQMYLATCGQLAKREYVQEEVSNWSLLGFSCRHNWKYWERKTCLGIGTGAFGYLETIDGIGYDYHFGKKERFLGHVEFKEGKFFPEFNGQGLYDFKRTRDTAVIELVATGLRTMRGISLNRLKQLLGNRQIEVLENSLQDSSHLNITDGRLRLDYEEWFREHYWANHLIDLLL